jgi:hypothetical protein
MCVPDNDTGNTATSTSVCEVYSDVIRQNNQFDPGVAHPERQQRRVGFAMAGMAYHELMHNKIDPYEWAIGAGPSWDLHAHGGAGLALATISGGQTYTTPNITHMADHVHRDRRQYILRPAGAAQQAGGGAPGAGQPAAAGSGTGAGGQPGGGQPAGGQPGGGQPASSGGSPASSGDPLGGDLFSDGDDSPF